MSNHDHATLGERVSANGWGTRDSTPDASEASYEVSTPTASTEPEIAWALAIAEDPSVAERRAAAGAAPASPSDARACASSPSDIQKRGGGAGEGDECVICGASPTVGGVGGDESVKTGQRCQECMEEYFAHYADSDDEEAEEPSCHGRCSECDFADACDAAPAQKEVIRDAVIEVQEQIAEDMLHWGYVTAKSEVASYIRTEAERATGLVRDVLRALASEIEQRNKPERERLYREAHDLAVRMGADVREVRHA